MAATSRVEKCKENKTMKCEEEEEGDFISELPDHLIQHILSFLPSTKDAIRTGVLSKRWLHQWTHVPILIFNCNNGMIPQNYPNFIDNALNLYNCSKINKFYIKFIFSNEVIGKLDMWVRFAASRDVKELILDCVGIYKQHKLYGLPKFLFNQALLVKLKIYRCFFMPKMGKVNWASLKALHLEFSCLADDRSIESVLSGSPLIEYLELRYCHGFEGLVIASRSLKTFCMVQSKLCARAIEISCPNLEKLELLHYKWFKCLKLKDLPSSVCVTLGFKINHDEDQPSSAEDNFKLVKEFLLQLQHVEHLKLGAWFLMVLSLAAARGESSLLLNNKCLTVIDPYSGIKQLALPISQLNFFLLEKLVIQLQAKDHFQIGGIEEMDKKFWEVDWSVFDNLVSHLKTIEIVGLFHISRRDSYNDVVKFVEFLLKNARMLEKMVLLESSRREMDFAHEVCKKLSYIRKSSPHAIVKVACLKVRSDWDEIVF